VTSMNAGVI